MGAGRSLTRPALHSSLRQHHPVGPLAFVRMVAGEDPFRPTWTIRSPSGQRLTLEFDRLRSHWRVTPGEYVRRRVADALAQATGSRPDAEWIVKFERELGAELQAR